MAANATQKNAARARRGQSATDRLEFESAADSDLVVMETKCVERAVIYPVQIIRADSPESSDADCNRRLDKKVIVAPVRSRGADRAEVIRVFVTAVQPNEKAPKQSLLHPDADVCDYIILA